MTLNDEAASGAEGFLLSPQQRRVWLHLHDGIGTRVNVAAVAELPDGLGAGALRAAFDLSCRRCEILRTRFHSLPGMTFPLQVIDEAPAGAFEERRASPGTDRSVLRSELLQEAQGRSFEPADGPLHWTCVVSLDSGPPMIATSHSALINDQRGVLAYLGLLVELARRSLPADAEMLQYADLADWYNEALNSEDGAPGRRFWSATVLPQDASRGFTAEADAATARFAPPQTTPVAVEPQLAAHLFRSAADWGTAAEAVVLACWAVLLARVLARDTMAVGCRFDGRDEPSLKLAPGPCQRYLPILIDAESGRSLRDLARDLHERLAEMADWQECFAWDKALGQGAKAIAATPLAFAFSWHDVAAAPPFASVTVTDDAEPYEAKLSCERHGEKLRVELAMPTTLRDRVAALDLPRRLGIVLRAALAEPDGTVADLPIAEAAELESLLAPGIGTTVSFHAPATLDRLLLRQMQATPQAVALRHDGNEITYGELEQVTRGLGCAVAGRTDLQGRVVAVLTRRSAELVLAAVSIVRLGAVYLPLDPALPDARLRSICADAEPAMILAAEPELERARTLAGDVRDLAAVLRSAGPPAPPAALDPEQPAYMLYTSGSTGLPKGVLVPHRAVRNFLLWSQSAFPLGPADRILLRAPIGFDASIWELFAPLIAGASLIVAPSAADHDPSVIAESLVDGRATVLKTTPTLLQALLELGALRQATALRLIFSGAEKLPQAVAEGVFASGSRALLCNMYGPTEACVDVSFRICRGGDGDAVVPIGRPIANTRLYVLDRRMRPVPRGVPGELFIGGANLALGYHRRAELLAERFVPDPFRSDGGMLFRTGDLVRFTASGELAFLGRNDSQVKIRGARVELEEIENTLLAHPDVSHCAVLHDAERTGKIAAYVVARGGADGLAGIRAFLESRLPDYMVPTFLLALPALPRLPSGKLDRSALPDPAGGRRPETFVAPRNPVEEDLAGILAEVLRLDRVGADDDFFELGGDSILSVQVVSRANERGLGLTVRQIFDHRTVAGMAANLQSAPPVVAEQGPVSGAMPLMPVQLRLLERDLPDLHHFNQAMMFEVSPGLDTQALDRTLGKLVEHHDALRLRLRRTGGAWRQEIAPPGAGWRLDIFDVAHLDAMPRRAAIEEHATRLQSCLDLEHGPTIVAGLFRTPAAEPDRLLIVAHHLGIDGVSWRILLEDLCRIYAALSGGRTPALPPKTTSFREWANRIRQIGRDGLLEPELRYWLDERRRSMPGLPLDFPDGIERNLLGEARSLTSELPSDITNAILTMAPRAFGTQINDVLLTALARTMHAWTGVPRMIADMDAHGREELFQDVNLSRTVGWFTSVFPAMVAIEPGADILSTLRHVQEQMRQVPDRGLSYGILRYASTREETRRSLAELPPAQLSFNYLGQLDQVISLPPLLGWAPEDPGLTQSPRGRMQHLLEINGFVVSRRLALQWTYCPHLHRRETVERLATNFCAEMTALAGLARGQHAA